MEPQAAERQSVSLITAVAALLGAGLLLAAIITAALQPPDSSSRSVAIEILTVGAIILTLLLGREILERRRRERISERASSALERFGQTFEEALAELTFPDLLDELAQRATASVEAGWTAVLLTDADTGRFRVAAATADAPRSTDQEVDPGTVTEGVQPGRLVVPLKLENVAFGVLEVGERAAASFDRDDIALIRIVADRIAVEIERGRLADAERRSRLGATQARAHLALIAEVSIELARAIEDMRPAMEAIADLLVAEFADLCTIYLGGPDGRIDRMAGRRRDLGDGSVLDLSDDLPGMRSALQRVLASGRSELTFVATSGAIHGVDDEHGESLRRHGMTSWVIAPVRVGGLPLGSIVAATGPGRRGYRPSDQAVVEELANRVAISVERSVLYSEMRQAGLAAERRAEQLGKLIEAAIALNPSRTPADLLVTLVDQAAQLLEAPLARAWLSGDDGLEAAYGTQPTHPVRSGSPIVDARGQDTGFLSVTRAENEPFTAGDDAVLTLLARLASAAVQNARLYADVRVREERLQALFEASPLAVLEFDIRGGMRDANPAAMALFGTGAASGAMGLPRPLRDCLGGMTARALAGDVAEAEVVVEVDRGRLDLWVSTAPLRGHDALPTGVLAVVSDMTERKRLEEQLKQAHRYEAIAQLAGGIAHDFNNLLTIILGYSDLLLHTMPSSSVERDDVSAIHQAGQHAAVITNQLLTLSRNQVVQPIVVPVRATCEALVPMLRRLAGDQVTVRMACDTDASIRMDAGQLEQVLFNLVLNSRDAMSDGGEIEIRTEETAGEDGHATVGLVVSDTGTGMDADTLARCREPFFTTKGRRGIGLGLATVATIVQRAGGGLDIESAPDQGTSISVFFPVVAKAPSPVESTWNRRPARVLLVDDDELVRRFAYKALSDVGYDVTSVDDAEAALATASGNGGFDLIVSDVVLPGMNGLDLVRAFGQRWPATARLLMTGFAGTDTTGTDLENVQVLKKPFAVDELTRAADDALKQFEL